MGLSGGSTVQKSEPWAPAQPYILNNLKQTQATYDANQPNLQKYAGMQQGTYGRVAPGAEQGITEAQGLVNDNISGKNLNGNPYLDAIIGRTNRDVTAGVNDQFGSAGRFGSGYHTAILADSLANADNQARFNNYAMERNNQQAGIGQAQGLMGGAQGLLNNAAELPWIGTNAANGGIRTASNGYGTQTTTTNPSIMSMLIQAGSNAAQAAAAGSDRRLKTNIVHVCTLPDGLDVYDFDYIAAPNPEIGAVMPEGRQRGVIADDVALLRPWALGPVVGGFKTVYYGKLNAGAR